MKNQKFNPYRAWAGDKRVWSQVKELPMTIQQTCKACQKSFEVQEIRLDCLCVECINKAAK